MDKKIEEAILKTLVYSDIFDYPLSKAELWKFLVGKKIDKKIFIEFLKDVSLEKVYCKKNLYFIYGRDKIVDVRIKRRKESKKKMVFARKIIKKLTFLPTVQFIGISGALSLENSEKDDDIDLFVIVSRGSLWLTRLVMIILLMSMGRYRRRNESEVSDKICLNMLIDHESLVFPKIRQNLYTAHEIAQLMPVFDRNDMYEKFMSSNKWVEKFLPNATTRIMPWSRVQGEGNHELGIKEGQKKSLFIIHYSLFILEHLAKIIQLWFINKHITNETVTDSLLAFHPFDYKKKVSNEYERRLKLYEV